MKWIVAFTGLFVVWFFIVIFIPQLNTNYNFVLGEYGHRLSNQLGLTITNLNKHKHLDIFMKDIFANIGFD
jgi:hypothetical protein